MKLDELANHQKLSCTFTLDVPGLGYLEGGTEADVSLASLRCAIQYLDPPNVDKKVDADNIDPSTSETRTPILASTNSFTKVSPVLLLLCYGSSTAWKDTLTIQ
jgi:hypothetical protein